AHDGHRGLHLGLSRRHQVIVVDRVLPGIDGLDLVRRLRRVGVTTRVLMLTALGELADRVEGLDVGADDYLVKPFELDELLARMRALLRRSAPLTAAETLHFADLSLDLGSLEARRGSRRIELTVTEANLLELFLRNPRQVLPRTLIYERVWGYDFGRSSNALEVYIGYVRRKTEADG